MRVTPTKRQLIWALPILIFAFALIPPVLSALFSHKTPSVRTLDARTREQRTHGVPNTRRTYRDNNNQLIRQEKKANSLQEEHQRPIQNYQITNLLLASDIEGGLHALNRETGELIWSLETDQPLVEISSNFSYDKPIEGLKSDKPDENLVWIVEPYGDGNLYFFNTEFGLNKLPISITQLVSKSPFALNDDDKVYTGVRKSSLYTIDLPTGKIVSAYGPDCTTTEAFCEKETFDSQNRVMVGKTTYELSIHSKNNLSWNVSYSTWGPNNIDSDLALQNTLPLDGTYIAPFSDSTLLAIDINSRIAKWVSQLPHTIVNVFDILNDYKSGNSYSNSYITIPHPLKPPHGFNAEEQTLATYLDVTSNGSWYAMSNEFYPSLVKSAPTSRFSLSERYRSHHQLRSKEEFNAAVVGVHIPTEAGIGYDEKATIGYPTSLPEPYPNGLIDGRPIIHRTDKIDDNDPPSPSKWVGLPSPSTSPLLQIDPSPRSTGFFDTVFGKFLFRCVENLFMALITGLIIYVFIKLNWIPSLNALLKRNGLELKEVEIEPLSIIPEINVQPVEVVEVEEKQKKEVRIVEPDEEEKMSTENNNNGVKKRKRGSRGGRKNKKNSEVEKIEEIPLDSDLTLVGKPIVPKVSGLTLSDNILGYGSYGTVVFKGTFQKRDVAVKRMLIDFYDVASHEINLLTESDDHPNVIRYFYSETSDKFLYIALELCSASLEDVIEKPDKHKDLTKLMDPVNVLEQIAEGVHHLHSLKIVHRDIKPQNILVAPPKKLKTRDERFSPVRILISDFGLCKRLEADESSFKATTQHAAGTSGWRAPELLLDSSNNMYNSTSFNSDQSFTNNTSSNSIAEPLAYDILSNRKLTRAIDIFSLGCCFYYILTNGGHPFGDRYLREGNVIKNEYSLDLLDILPENTIEAKDLISKMISRNPKSRPNTSQVLRHPFFWSHAKKLEFLLKVSDRFEIERRDPPSELLQKLEKVAPHVLDNDWCARFDKTFMDNLGKYRKYHPDRLMDLLRALRNKYHHFNDLPEELMNKMSPLPDGFYHYFNKKFPNMLMEIYEVVGENLSHDPVLEVFF